MKKSLIISAVLVLILSISGCGAPLENRAGDASNIQEIETPDSESPAPSVTESMQTTLPPEPIRAEWAVAYAEALTTRYGQDMENTVCGGAFDLKLQDLDLDGVPELLFAYFGTENPFGAENYFLFLGYTYREGEIQLIRFPENGDGWLPQSLELYRDLRTGGLQWEARVNANHIGASRYGDQGAYYHDRAFIDFSDLTRPVSESFFTYEEVQPGGENEGTYTILGGSGNSETITSQTMQPHIILQKYYNDTMICYKQIVTRTPFIAVKDVLAEGSETSFDRDKLCAFFETWDGSAPVPEAQIEAAPEWDCLLPAFRSLDNDIYWIGCSYCFYDMDRDGSPELIMKTGGCEADFMYHIFTMADGELVKCGWLSGSHAVLYANGEIGIVRYAAHMGGYEVTINTLNGTALETREIASGVKENGEQYPTLEALGYGEYDQWLEFDGMSFTLVDPKG